MCVIPKIQNLHHIEDIFDVKGPSVTTEQMPSVENHITIESSRRAAKWNFRKDCFVN